MKQVIRVGHSPDPDDAFMFYALANGKIDTGDYEFTHELVDIETLNRRAFKAKLELTAVSLHAYAFLHDKYILCSCGASMGDGYGPMVVARRPMTIADLRLLTIAVPGKLTSAFLALRLCLGQDFACVEVPFDHIIPAVSAGEYDGQEIDAGLIIHEGQLTYGKQNLQLIVDLGRWWQDKTGLPLPLGANAVRKNRHGNGPRHRAASQEASPTGWRIARGAQYAPLRPRSGCETSGPLCRHVRERLTLDFGPRPAEIASFSPRPCGGSCRSW
jgi:1,4-dihydroxy-6-naphthoate synthase